MARTKIDGGGDRAARWEQYKKYLDDLEKLSSPDGLKKGDELKPGTLAYKRLRELSDQLGEVAEKDFQARQLKMEIDRALQAAADGGGLLQAFAKISRKRDVEE